MITAAGFTGKKQSPGLTHLHSPHCCNLKLAAVELEMQRDLSLSLCGLVGQQWLSQPSTQGLITPLPAGDALSCPEAVLSLSPSTYSMPCLLLSGKEHKDQPMQDEKDGNMKHQNTTHCSCAGIQEEQTRKDDIKPIFRKSCLIAASPALPCQQGQPPETGQEGSWHAASSSHPSRSAPHPLANRVPASQGGHLP